MLKEEFNMNVEGYTNTGRPKKRCMDYVKADVICK